MTHLFNAQTPLMHRDPGVVGAALSDARVSCEMIADMFHVHPKLFDMLAQLKRDKLVLITDCTRAGGLADGEYTLGGQPIFPLADLLREKGAPFAFATGYGDAGLRDVDRGSPVLQKPFREGDLARVLGELKAR